MQTTYHKADSRGHANHGWLDSHHTFSFADYYDPERVHFGALRVLNDDQIEGGMGFGTHPHDNMEIISIPLTGDLEHKDSMGNIAVIREGDIQVMSAGRGIYHSEYNKSNNKTSNFLQIWIFPAKRNVEPRYDQISIREVAIPNELYQILSPNPNDQGVWIHQNAWFHMGDLYNGWTGNYQLKSEGNGVYFFLIEGIMEIAGHKLQKRDGLGVWDASIIELKALSDSKVLVMEVPME